MGFYWKNILLHACNDEHKVNLNDNNWIMHISLKILWNLKGNCNYHKKKKKRKIKGNCYF